MSLFLDFDGTLVELADRPHEIRVSVELTNLLKHLVQRLEGRVGIVSGRSISQLDEFLENFCGGVALVGSHGAEMRTPGSALIAPAPPKALGDAERRFSEAFKETEGVLIEVKTQGVAIHYRLAPSAADTATRLAIEFAAEHGLELQEGKLMVEVRQPGHDKGTGIAALMRMPPFADYRPVFLGDDLTDEPGFRHCAELGGFGVLVGTPRPSAAQYYLKDVAAVHEWLGAL
jgi:trehalose 6-phosphate phosphatase